LNTEENLDDVVLVGRPLVTGNTAEWLVPPSTGAADDLWSWWQSLVDDDNRAWRAGLTHELRERLLYLRSLYFQLDATGDMQVAHLSRVRSVVRHICQSGLTVEQTAQLLGVTPLHVMRAIYCRYQMTVDEFERRLAMERMLRADVPTDIIIDQTGFSVSEIHTQRKALGIAVSFARMAPKEVRDQAMQWRREGLTNRQISDKFAANGLTVTTDRIAQWWHRYGKEVAA
jgi:AraC-like DNA-binding protein